MTATKDTYDDWTEDAYEYVRDQLRSNATVGLAGSERVQVIEVGAPDIEGLLQTGPDTLPQIWIEPPRRPTAVRQGEVIQHQHRVEVHVFSSAVYGTGAQWAEAQKRHRELAGRVYNETLHLHDAGITAGHWHDWEPDGEGATEAGRVEHRIVFHSVVPFRLTRDRLWLQGV